MRLLVKMHQGVALACALTSWERDRGGDPAVPSTAGTDCEGWWCACSSSSAGLHPAVCSSARVECKGWWCADTCSSGEHPAVFSIVLADCKGWRCARSSSSASLHTAVPSRARVECKGWWSIRSSSNAVMPFASLGRQGVAQGPAPKAGGIFQLQSEKWLRATGSGRWVTRNSGSSLQATPPIATLPGPTFSASLAAPPSPPPLSAPRASCPIHLPLPFPSCPLPTLPGPAEALPRSSPPSRRPCPFLPTRTF